MTTYSLTISTTLADGRNRTHVRIVTAIRESIARKVALRRECAMVRKYGMTFESIILSTGVVA